MQSTNVSECCAFYRLQMSWYKTLFCAEREENETKHAVTLERRKVESCEELDVASVREQLKY